MNKYLISFLKLYYEYIREPYNWVFQHNDQIPSFLSNHYQHL